MNRFINASTVKELNCRGKKLSVDSPLLMGILNVTPDSFSDGGVFSAPAKAIARVEDLINQGADIIDVGGETTKPGSKRVQAAEEIKRVRPVIEAIRKRDQEIVVSIDTTKSEVARIAIQAGADVVNDISALRFDKGMTELLAEYDDVSVVLMHMQGTPETMQRDPKYRDVIAEIKSFFDERIEHSISKGIAVDRLLIDPGIGFGKTYAHNLEILRRIEELHSLGLPIVLGASRKSFISQIYPSKAAERLVGSLTVASSAFFSGVQVFRVHDVIEHQQLFRTLTAIYSVPVS